MCLELGYTPKYSDVDQGNGDLTMGFEVTYFRQTLIWLVKMVNANTGLTSTLVDQKPTSSPSDNQVLQW